MIGIRILLPLPSTLLCRSLEGGFLTALRVPLFDVVCSIMTPLDTAPSLFAMDLLGFRFSGDYTIKLSREEEEEEDEEGGGNDLREGGS